MSDNFALQCQVLKILMFLSESRVTRTGDTTNTSRTVASWLSNLVEELESAGNPLEYVFFASGNKYYGATPSVLSSLEVLKLL